MLVSELKLLRIALILRYTFYENRKTYTFWRYNMEELLVKLGEIAFTELDEAEDIRYLDREMGYMFVLRLKGGDNVLVSLSKL